MKLFLRFRADVNEALRSLLRYRGDLSRFVEEALSSPDLSRLFLLPPEERVPRQRRYVCVARAQPAAQQRLRVRGTDFGDNGRHCRDSINAESAHSGMNFSNTLSEAVAPGGSRVFGCGGVSGGAAGDAVFYIGDGV